MARRDRVSELMAIKERSGHRGGRFPSLNDLEKLRTTWVASAGPKELLASLLPGRLVTLIEVFCRYWVEKLIDRGAPYAERAAGLKIDVKYDLSMVRSLHGQTISLGLLISNSVSLSTIESINSVFSVLLERDFFDWLKDARSRVSIEDGDDAEPIVADVDTLKRVFARLFEVRHILVHEFPQELPLSPGEIDEMITAASTFLDAADEGFTQLIFGRYPINQREMNSTAQAEAEAAEKDLEKLVAEVVQKSQSDTILNAQKAWRAFAEAEANRNAEGFTGGTAYPLMYWMAMRVLTIDRSKQLQSWLNEQQD